MDKLTKIFLVTSAAAAVAIPGVANAGTATSNLSVTATVNNTCTVSTAPVAFGSVDLTGGNVDGTGTVTVTCTNGASWSAAAGVGTGTGATLASRKMTAGSNLLNYSLYTTSGYGTVWGDGTGTTGTISNTGTGSAQAFTVYGRIPSGQTSVPAGSYSDTVQVTVTY